MTILAYKLLAMKKILILFMMLLNLSTNAHENDSIEAVNRKIAMDFYEDLWFTNNTDNYSKYVADTYVVHDIGDRKGVTEPAIEQKNTADFFWENGEWNNTIDYQVVEGDMVVTRWQANYKPKTLLGRIAIGESKIPIINVFRIQNGKIVEIWNHRHDIDTSQTMKFTMKGLLFGLLIALIPLIAALRYKRKLKQLKEV
ncbi:hypothetical protein E1140_05230 [Fulvivirga lutimaris]|nr:hypothetical protein [Fulvivirga lutimaris]